MPVAYLGPFLVKKKSEFFLFLKFSYLREGQKDRGESSKLVQHSVDRGSKNSEMSPPASGMVWQYFSAKVSSRLGKFFFPQNVLYYLSQLLLVEGVGETSVFRNLFLRGTRVFED